MRKIFTIFIFLLTMNIFSLNIINDIIGTSEKYLGTPYINGGISPSGFDCSGFVNFIYKPHVPKIPRISRDIAGLGSLVKLEGLIPGDLVFFATGSNPEAITHVAIFIGQKSVIHAVSNGPKTGVIISKLDTGYWRRKYLFGKRLFNIPSQAEKTSTYAEIKYERGIYKGEILNGEPNGKGEMHLSNKDKYIGTFLNGLFSGNGKYIWVNGDVYSGEFKSGHFSGQGVIQYKDGSSVQGIFISGVFNKGWFKEAEKKYWIKFSEGKGYVIYKDETETRMITESEKLGSIKSMKSKIETKSKEGNYIFKKDSVWEDWDGEVYGDYFLWKEQEEKDFEEWKRKNEAGYR